MDFHPILDCNQAADFEKTLLGTSEEKSWEAMSKAGETIGRNFLSEFGGILPSHPKMLFLCGRGHNGGDALVLAKFLSAKVPDAFIDIISDTPDKLRPNTLRALYPMMKGENKNIKISGWDDGKRILSGKYDLLAEGVVGMSFVPPMRKELSDRIDTANSVKADIKISIDLPAGICDESENPKAFRADATYAAGIVKSPLIKEFNEKYVGRIRYCDIGFFDAVSEDFHSKYKIAAPSLLRRLKGIRPAACDKRSFGHLMIIGGSEKFPGAVLMNVRAALRSGVGLVTALVPEFCAAAFAAVEPSAIWVGCSCDESGAISLENYTLAASRMDRCDAVAVGSGLTDSRETRALVCELLKNFPSKPFVIDADAVCSETANLLSMREAKSLMTPHRGEFLRIAKDVSDASLEEVSDKYNSAILLKGNISRICRGKETFLLTSGSPALARGGSGDLLCGLAGGLLAQSAKSGTANPFLAGCTASEWLGRAGIRAAAKLSENSLSSSDFMVSISESVRDF